MMKDFFDAHHGHLLLVAEATQSSLQFSFDEDIKNSWGRVVLVREGWPNVRLDSNRNGTVEASIVPPADKWGRTHSPSSYSDYRFTKANFKPTRQAHILAGVIKRLIMENDGSYREAWRIARNSEKRYEAYEATARAAVESMKKHGIEHTANDLACSPSTAPFIWFSANGNSSKQVVVNQSTVRVELDVDPEKLGELLALLK